MRKAWIVLRYLWEVNRELPGKWRQKKRILSQIAATVRDYVFETEQVDYISLLEEYGEPCNIALEYIGSMSNSEIISNMKHSARILKIMLVSFCVGVSIWLAAVVFLCYHSINSFYGYVDVELTIAEETAQEE